MPFIAINEKDERYVSYELTPIEYRQDWRCPQCDGKFSFVDCVTRIKHFRHLVEHHCQWEPESKEHLELKKLVYDTLKFGFFVDYEVRIGNNIADVVATRNHQKFAIECQVSPVSSLAVLLKNQEYLREGFSPIWILRYGNFAKREEYRKVGGFEKICVGEIDGRKCFERGEFHYYKTPRRYYLYHLKAIERKYQDEGWLLYYFPGMGFYRLQFTPKWAHGDKAFCETIYFGKLVRVYLPTHLKKLAGGLA